MNATLQREECRGVHSTLTKLPKNGPHGRKNDMLADNIAGAPAFRVSEIELVEIFQTVLLSDILKA